MSRDLSTDLSETGILALMRSPFLMPSLALHLFALYLAASINSVIPKRAEAPIPIQLLEFGSGGSPDRSIGPQRGPGGPKTAPKLGNPVTPREQRGDLDKGSVEVRPEPVEAPAAPPSPPALPGPKTLADARRAEPAAVKETAPDSLVQLPTRQNPGDLSAPTPAQGTKKSFTPGDPGADAARLRALKEGSALPGELKGTGGGAGPYGVPGGVRNGTGVAGGGTGSGSGGGSLTGLRGAAADYEEYYRQIERRVRSVWRYPDEVTGVHNLRIRFTVDRAGKLLNAEVVDSTDPRLNTSAIEAMRRASPFPPLPESIKDIAGDPLIIRFTVGNRVRS
ncbi:MAG TPA: TonB family protein [Candidatus Eisenbacteria bacterium]|nr:TonB family protein [Candidatus Eisenbacteria bacterium]